MEMYRLITDKQNNFFTHPNSNVFDHGWENDFKIIPLKGLKYLELKYFIPFFQKDNVLKELKDSGVGSDIKHAPFGISLLSNEYFRKEFFKFKYFLGADNAFIGFHTGNRDNNNTNKRKNGFIPLHFINMDNSYGNSLEDLQLILENDSNNLYEQLFPNFPRGCFVEEPIEKEFCHVSNSIKRKFIVSSSWASETSNYKDFFKNFYKMEETLQTIEYNKTPINILSRNCEILDQTNTKILSKILIKDIKPQNFGARFYRSSGSQMLQNNEILKLILIALEKNPTLKVFIKLSTLITDEMYDAFSKHPRVNLIAPRRAEDAENYNSFSDFFFYDISNFVIEDSKGVRINRENFIIAIDSDFLFDKKYSNLFKNFSNFILQEHLSRGGQVIVKENLEGIVESKDKTLNFLDLKSRNVLEGVKSGEDFDSFINDVKNRLRHEQQEQEDWT